MKVARDLLLDAEGLLTEAARTLEREGDQVRARVTYDLAARVMASDPEVQQRVYDALPRPGATRVRPETIAYDLVLSATTMYYALEHLRRSGRAETGGGYWRQRA